jgi:ribosomal protein S18 acetylase RimI-like enzyme
MILSPLRPEDRTRVEELLVATAAFSSEEVEVALELFDASHGGERRETEKQVRPFARDDHPSVVPTGALRATEGPAFSLPDYEFFGAYDADSLVGYVCFGPTPATDGTYDLYWLAVDPAAQGRGVGRALVQRVERELGLRGARLLVVETSSRADYSHTREFYARGGYAEAARVRDFYAPGDDRIILTTRLTAEERGVATR